MTTTYVLSNCQHKSEKVSEWLEANKLTLYVKN